MDIFKYIISGQNIAYFNTKIGRKENESRSSMNQIFKNVLYQKDWVAKESFIRHVQEENYKNID